MNDRKMLDDLMALNQELLDKISDLESRVSGETKFTTEAQAKAKTFPRKRSSFTDSQIAAYITEFGYGTRKVADVPALAELAL